MLKHKICWQILQWTQNEERGTRQNNLEESSWALLRFLLLGFLILHIAIPEAFASWSGRSLLRAYFSRRLSATQKASWKDTNHVCMAY